MRRVGGVRGDETAGVERVREGNGENINSSSVSVCDEETGTLGPSNCEGVWMSGGKGSS